MNTEHDSEEEIVKGFLSEMAKEQSKKRSPGTRRYVLLVHPAAYEFINNNQGIGILDRDTGARLDTDDYEVLEDTTGLATQGGAFKFDRDAYLDRCLLSRFGL